MQKWLRVIPKEVQIIETPFAADSHVHTLQTPQFEKMVSKAEKLPFRWVEDLVIRDAEQALLVPPSEMDASINAAAEEMMQNPISMSAVAVGTIPKLGLALFAVKRITKGQCLGIITGEFLHSSMTTKDNPHVVPNLAENKELSDSVINSLSCGNATRFIRPMPNKEELNKYKFFGTSRSNILTANLSCGQLNFGGFPYIFVYAERDIEPGEPLGYSLSLKFLHTSYALRHLQVFFTKDKKVIPREDYNFSDLYIFDEPNDNWSFYSRDVMKSLLVRILRNTEIRAANIRTDQPQIILTATQFLVFLEEQYNARQRKDYFGIDPCDEESLLTHATKLQTFEGTAVFHDFPQTLKELAQRNPNAKHVLEACNEGQFAKALRRACAYDLQQLVLGFFEWDEIFCAEYEIDERGGDDQKSALHWAVSSCRAANLTAAIKAILQKSPDMKVQDAQENTVLHTAAKLSNKPTSTNILTILLVYTMRHHVGEVDEVLNKEDKSGNTFDFYLTEGQRKELEPYIAKTNCSPNFSCRR